MRTIGDMPPRPAAGTIGAVAQEQPPSDARCVVDGCTRTAAVYVRVADATEVEGETFVIMCDVHAAHWNNNA